MHSLDSEMIIIAYLVFINLLHFLTVWVYVCFLMQHTVWFSLVLCFLSLCKCHYLSSMISHYFVSRSHQYVSKLMHTDYFCPYLIECVLYWLIKNEHLFISVFSVFEMLVLIFLYFFPGVFFILIDL